MNDQTKIAELAKQCTSFELAEMLISTKNSEDRLPVGMTKDQVTKTIKKIINFAEMYQCEHEEVYRGGSIWTICQQCGKKWADDEGGYVPYEQPKEIIEAWELYEKLTKGE